MVRQFFVYVAMDDDLDRHIADNHKQAAEKLNKGFGEHFDDCEAQFDGPNENEEYVWDMAVQYVGKHVEIKTDPHEEALESLKGKVADDD